MSVQMDPALREALRLGTSDRHGVIEAIVRLRSPGDEVPGVRLVSRFGTVATCRLALDEVPAAHDRPQVASLKAARWLLPQRAVDSSAGSPTESAPPPRRSGLTGAGVVVGVVDWGLDFDHPDFRDDNGGTRLLALWDQRGERRPGSPDPYGYGVLHTRDRIDDALAGNDPYPDLGYHPADADPGRGTHGTHVTGIAAGNGRGGGPPGVAPEAELVFVHLADRGTAGRSGLGDSVRLLEAVDFVIRTAGDRPVAINLSVGRMGGRHDGRSAVEQAFDQLLAARPGVCIVDSGGNYRRARTHASGTLRAGQRRDLRFVTPPGDTTVNEVEVWYAGSDRMTVRLRPPPPAPVTTVELGTDSPIRAGGRQVGWLYHRAHDPDNGDHHVDAFLAADAPAGTWTLTLEARTARQGRFDAWIERDDPGQARFWARDSDRTGTLGTIATGHLPLVVGAYDDHHPNRPAAVFTSSGPTRDGRAKPDLAAPGVRITAARSAPRRSRRSPGDYTEKSGTSMAAPYVTGCAALCLQGLGGAAGVGAVRAVLLTAAAKDTGPPDRERLGRGRLELGTLLETLIAGPADGRRRDDKDAVMTDDAPALDLGPDRIYRELIYRPDGTLARWMSRRFTTLAGPGESLPSALQVGDLLLTVRLGHSDRGRWARLSGAECDRAGGPGAAGWYVPATSLSDPDISLRCRLLDTRAKLPAGSLVLRPNVQDQDSAQDPVFSGTPEQLDFRTRVLAAHLARARRARGAPQADLPATDLRQINGTDIVTARLTADAVEQLLSAATTDLVAAGAAGDPDAQRTIRLTVTSGYRSGATQDHLWNQYFSAPGGYYDRTRTARAALTDGPHSDQAVDYLLAPRGQGGFGLGGRIAAPGYSNHQNGIAVDLLQARTAGHRIRNDSDGASRARWRASWFHHWLLDNAQRFGFRALPTEEWHWELAARSQRRTGPDAGAVTPPGTGPPGAATGRPEVG